MDASNTKTEMKKKKKKKKPKTWPCSYRDPCLEHLQDTTKRPHQSN